MYHYQTGYLAVFLLLIFASAVVELPHHPNPILGALAYLVLIPSMLVAFSSEYLIHVDSNTKKTLRVAIESGETSRLKLVLFGAGVGVSAFGITIAAYFVLRLLPNNESAMILFLAIFVLTLFLSPIFGFGVLVSRIKK